MLRKIINSFIAALLIAAPAYADNVVIRNDNLVKTLPTDLTSTAPITADQYGRIVVIGQANAGTGLATSGTIDTSSTSNTFGPVDCTGLNTWRVSYTRTAETGNLSIQSSYDGTNYNTISNFFRESPNYGEEQGEGTTSGGSLTIALANGTNSYFGSCAGAKYIRVKVASAGAGTLPISLQASPSIRALTVTGIFPGTTSAQLGKAEDAASASGDALVGVAGVVNEAGTALAAVGDYTTPALTQSGAVQANLSTNFRTSALTSPYASEDEAFSNTQALMMSGGVNNRSQSVFNSTNGDATPFGVGDYGELAISMSPGSQTFANSAIQAEDAAVGASSGVVMAGAQREDALTANTGTSGDATPLKTDSSGRLITTMAPMGETFQSCGTATASTADVAIKAAVASNRMYVTGVTCASSDADNATNINFKDGSTVIAVGGVNQMATTSAGTFTATFPVPLRGTSNTALNFNTAVSTSSVICCASGYISTQ